MPTFDITAPDGKQYEIEGATSEGALAALKKHLGASTSPASFDRNDPRFSNMTQQKFLEGLPIVGGLVNKAGAAISAAANPVTGIGSQGETFGDRYAHNLEQEKAASADFDKQHPVLSPALQVAGGVVGTIPAVMAAPAAFGIGAGGLAARSAASMLTGGAVGAGDAAVRSEGDADAIKTAGGVGAFTGALSPAVASGVGKVAAAIANRARPIAVPTQPELVKSADIAYRAADAAGVKFSQPAYTNAANAIERDLLTSGLDKDIHPAATAALKRITEARGLEPSLSEVDTLRKVARGAAESLNKADRGMATQIINGIDDFVDRAGPGGVVAGDAAAGASAISEARSLWQAKSKAEMVAEAIAKAERRAASTGSGGNADNAIRQNIRAILDSPSKSRGLSTDERDAMEKIVRGGSFQNLTRLAGKLSPVGSGLMSALGLGATAANPMLAAVPAAGMVAKAIADRATRSNVHSLEQTILNRGVKPVNAAAQISEEKARMIARAMLSQAPLVANQRR